MAGVGEGALKTIADRAIGQVARWKKTRRWENTPGAGLTAAATGAAKREQKRDEQLGKNRRLETTLPPKQRRERLKITIMGITPAIEERGERKRREGPQRYLPSRLIQPYEEPPLYHAKEKSNTSPPR